MKRFVLVAGLVLSCSGCASQEFSAPPPEVIAVPAPTRPRAPVKEGPSHAERRELDRKIDRLQKEVFPTTNYARPGEIDTSGAR